MKLLLASSSRYRRQQLAQLGIPFESASPDIDETPQAGESIDAYVERLAIEKARALSDSHPDHWIIGSDQSCSVNGEIVGKPHGFDKAFTQLKACVGKSVRFSTGIALWYQGQVWSRCEHFDVAFRQLDDDEIRRYLELEQPYDCAGSFKVEGLGIHLFEGLHGNDINSLIGLPLISLLNLMRDAGLQPLSLVANKPAT
ncbi:Maf family protein [Oceanobacter kriegii]|uniref:Maf family protein n=1 Tax=Oceanobacter kriegii TaxID=64972 RepID=UPI0004040450|nr:nucleoside triphosphate pyrophosphatase [Oceanobacter kriegii]